MQDEELAGEEPLHDSGRSIGQSPNQPIFNLHGPWLGKYLQPDAVGGQPLRLPGGQALPQAADRYQYAGNSPTGVGEAAGTTAPVMFQPNPISIAARDTIVQTALGYGAGRAIETTAWGGLTIITSRSTWYRTIGQASLNLRSLFGRSVAQPQLGRTFRAYTTLGRVRSLGNGRYLAETGEIIDATGLPPSAVVRFAPLLSPELRIAAGGVMAFGISAAFQGLEDWNNPYLTPEQRTGRAVVSGFGGVGAWIIGLGATEIAAGAGAGAWAGPIGIVVGAGVTFVWITVVQPAIFEARGLNPHKNLAPLQN